MWEFKIIRKEKPSLVGEGLLNFLKLERKTPEFWKEIDRVVFYHRQSGSKLIISSFPFTLVRKNIISLGKTPLKAGEYFYYEIHLQNGRMFQLRYNGQVREILQPDKIWTPGE